MNFPKKVVEKKEFLSDLQHHIFLPVVFCIFFHLIMAKIEKLYWKKIFLKFFVANLTYLCTFTNSSKREGMEGSFYRTRVRSLFTLVTN